MNEEATVEEMGMALNSSRYAMDDKLHVEFHYEPMIHNAKTKEAGRPIYHDVLFCRITPPGGQTVDQPITDMYRQRFADRLAKWEALQGEVEGIEGFRVEEWPQITRSEAETLKYMKIYTVEQLADTPDGNLQGLMGGVGLKIKAKEYLEKTNGAEAQLAAMAKRIEELEAAANGNEPQKRRGRPKKVEEE